MNKDTNSWKKALYVDGNLYDEKDPYAQDTRKEKATNKANDLKQKALFRRKSLNKNSKAFEKILTEKGWEYSGLNYKGRCYELPHGNPVGSEELLKLGVTDNTFQVNICVDMDDYSDAKTLYATLDNVWIRFNWRDLYEKITKKQLSMSDGSLLKAYEEYDSRLSDKMYACEDEIRSILKGKITSEKDLSEALDEVIECLRSFVEECISLFEAKKLS